MFKRILVPLDGSDLAEQAIPVAARIARNAGGVVILAQVAPIPVDFQAQEKNPAEIYDDNLIEQGEALAVNYLDHVSRMAELVGVATRTQALFGDVAPAILTAVESLGIDLIVMCSPGYTGFKRWALGSVAQKIVPHSSVPVLLLRDGGSMPASKSAHALVALDGSPMSEAVLEPVVALVAALAPAAQKTLHLVRVVDLPVNYGKFRSDAFDLQAQEDLSREAHKYLARIAARLTEDDYAPYDLTIITSVIVQPDVAEALTNTVVETTHDHFDLIAMATHGRGGLQRWTMGSVTERVLHSTRLPMLIVHSARHSTQTQEDKEQAKAVL